MIKRIIEIFGLLASVLALSSLIYGAFQEPLGPYMQGIMGGVMDVYRNIRDMLFHGLNWAFSGLINWAGGWLTWLPPAPWFSLSPIQKDLISLWLFFAVPLYPMLSRSMFDGLPSEFSLFEARVFVPLMTIIFSILWPIYIVFCLYFLLSSEKDNNRGPVTIVLRPWLVAVSLTLLGSIAFFLIVYAENRIGL